MKKMIIYGVIAVWLVSTASSCEKSEHKIQDGKELTLTPEEQQKVRQDNLFAFQLFKQATSDLQGGQNALLSPLSISTALAMTANGAKGTTRDAIARTLKFADFDADMINEYYQKLITDLPLLDPKTDLSMANSIWYRQGFEVLPDFLDVSHKFYKAEVAALDFTDPKAPENINNWVSRNTNDKIPTIVDQIPDYMIMYLINAVYFKGSWEQQFDPSATRQGLFYRINSNPLETEFMQIEHTFDVAANEFVEAIELPYQNKRYSMIVLKPADGKSPSEVLSELNQENRWEDLMSGFSSRKTKISLPKFKFSYENQLKDELTALGMGEAFSDGADFTGINETGAITIGEVKHKSFIEVNEEGAEAAAVTSVGIVVTSLPQIYTFNVDRPFLFAIREMSTGLILFIGQVNDPSVEQSQG